MSTSSVISVIIEILNGAEDGKVVEFSKFPVMLGRHPEDNLIIPCDNKVSRHHARILIDETGLFVEDVGWEGQGSTNGTYHNGERISGKSPLQSNDTLVIGNCCLRVRLGTRRLLA